jgi:NAD(P)-dependent dehydrogenase (short-subunit alcohol dehydrogenase family)
MSTAFLPLLAAATSASPGRSASIINTSSISGITRTSQHHPSYNVSKAATIQLNMMLAQEFSQPGVKVRVNRSIS